MRILENWYLTRATNRVYYDMNVLGSSHSQWGFRHKWSPLRLLFGEMKVKFFHPGNVACTCEWKKDGNHTLGVQQ